MKFASFSFVAVAVAASSVLSAKIPQQAASDLEARSNFGVFASYDRIHNEIKGRWTRGVTFTDGPPTGDDIRTPGYKFLWGPRSGASRQGNYISHKVLDSYDLDACAAECGRHNRDLGVCEGFNIFRGSFKGDPVAVVCLTFGNAPDSSQATFRQKGGFTVDWSRGYERTQIVQDQNFRSAAGQYWTTSGNASIVNYDDYYYDDDRTSVDYFDGDYGLNEDADLQGSIKSVPLNTVVGRPYTLLLAYQATPGNSSLFQLRWNGKKFGHSIVDDPFGDKKLIAAKTPVAVGNDIIEFYGGSVGGSWAIDLVQLFVV